MLHLDVVQAYKGLQKEKSALERSLRVLSAGATVDSGEKDSNDDGGVKEESENTAKESENTAKESENTAKESIFDSSKPPSSQEFKPEQTEVSLLGIRIIELLHLSIMAVRQLVDLTDYCIFLPIALCFLCDRFIS